MSRNLEHPSFLGENSIAVYGQERTDDGRLMSSIILPDILCFVHVCGYLKKMALLGCLTVYFICDKPFYICSTLVLGLPLNFSEHSASLIEIINPESNFTQLDPVFFLNDHCDVRILYGATIPNEGSH